MPCPIPMPAPVEVSAAPTSPTMSSSFSLRNYPPPAMPGEMVFPMTPATSQPPAPAPFLQQAPLCESSASESGGSGASGPALPHGTQLLAEQLLHRQQQQHQRLYEAALGLDPSEGITDSIQGGSDQKQGGGPLQGDDVRDAAAVGHGRNRHLATTQLEFLTAAEECRC